MIFADTGYFLGLIHGRDGLHGRAMAWEASLQEPLLTTNAVLAELLNAMSGPGNRSKAALAVEAILGSEDCLVTPMGDELFRQALNRYTDRPDQAWGLTDCVSFVVMEEHGVTRALAHDHHFEQAGFEALLRRDP